MIVSLCKHENWIIIIKPALYSFSEKEKIMKSKLKKEEEMKEMQNDIVR